MPLSQRPYSVNTYALSKIWFRSSSVNLREGDFAAINASVKKWLYSDLIFKPELLLLHRSVNQAWWLGASLSKVKISGTFYTKFC